MKKMLFSEGMIFMNNKFKSLGVMLDCSRNAVMTVSELKKFISLLAKMGYNRFMLYTEDTYEVDGEPYFGYFRGRYTQEELKELDDFAFEKGVELIPCIQTLAHFTALVRWPEYNEINDINDILLVGDERTYNLIDKMFSSLRKCFRTNKLHIGMDEAHMLGKGKYLDINGLVDKNRILLSHLKRVCELCTKYNFEPMMWSDMFYRIASGGEYYNCNANFDPSVKASIPEGLSLVFWDYYHIDEEFYDKMIVGHKQLSNNLLFAGGGWRWGSFAPNNEFSIKATEKAFTACLKNGIKDVFITLWGDNGAEASPYTVLPDLVYSACIASGITESAQIKQKFKEFTDCEYDDFMLLDLPDKSPDAALDDVINPSKYQLYNDCFMGIYDCGVYEGDSKHYSQLAERILDAAKRNTRYSYVFDTIGSLCYVLELKSEIGIKTRKAYSDKNYNELYNLINDYEEIVDRVEKLYSALRTQWYMENKAYGFEVHDIRLGGLIMRIKDCKKRLEDFCEHKIDVIEELEEKNLNLVDNKGLVRRWNEMVTGCIL